MVRHECYNEYGELVASFDLNVETCVPLIIEHKGSFYRPIHYDLTRFGNKPACAKCVPVSVVHCSKLDHSVNEQEE